MRTNESVADGEERVFHIAGKDDRDRLFVHDRVHLSRAGHMAIAQTVLSAIETAAQ
jgi:lysophospholipase L1-like esterase